MPVPTFRFIMNNTVIGIVIAVALAVVAWFIYIGMPGQDEFAQVQDLGMYPYVCDNGSTFILSPLEGLENVQVSADAQGMFTGTATLSMISPAHYSGIAPDGQEVGLTGEGETIRLTVGTEQAVCNPLPNPDSAPWNWGDAQ